MISMAQQFAQHPPGMAVHGGHPMAQGHPSNQGLPGGGQQPGVSLGPQMHAGVAGPGGPQVSQGGPMMAGMMPGGGPAGMPGAPSAHAQAHLNPGHQAQMFAQNPQMQMSKSLAKFYDVYMVLRVPILNRSFVKLLVFPAVLSRFDFICRLEHGDFRCFPYVHCSSG